MDHKQDFVKLRYSTSQKNNSKAAVCNDKGEIPSSFKPEACEKRRSIKSIYSEMVHFHRRPLFLILFSTFTLITVMFIFEYRSLFNSSSNIDHTKYTASSFDKSNSTQILQKSPIKKKKPPVIWLPYDPKLNTGRFDENGTDTCHPSNAALKLYMYELPGRFNFGMILNEFMDHAPTNLTFMPRYLGGLNAQHGIEHWMTVDLITSEFTERQYPCTAVRVRDPSEADMFWIPFFSSLAYNKYSKGQYLPTRRDTNTKMQTEIVDLMLSQGHWNKSGGTDHIIALHHPNSLYIIREKINAAMYIMADFGQFPKTVANLDKDVIAPYLHIVKTFINDTNTYDDRPTLLFFQGQIVRKQGGVIRMKIHKALKQEDGVIFATGNTENEGIRMAAAGMRKSKFCLHMAGDTPSSNRLFDAIVSHCIPVIISDEIELPFEDVIDYSSFCIFFKSADAVIPGHIVKVLNGISKVKWSQMWEKIKQVEIHFEYLFPSRYNDATHMIWNTIARRLKNKTFSRLRPRDYRTATNSQ